ncbi:hypothetical protein GCM10017691_43130 [Pseudonocardia petroleophila]|uniref:hypothetical protein n=1 Tax=Pseudonocardia petroleophila TaxID=37331 RepID=UPI0031CE911F
MAVPSSAVARSRPAATSPDGDSGRAVVDAAGQRSGPPTPPDDIGRLGGANDVRGMARVVGGVGRGVAVSGDLDRLREAAARGDRDAEDQLVELAAERADLDELRRLADSGSSDAVDVLVELAGERGDVVELGRLADAGSSDARDVLLELAGEDSAE